MSAVPAAPRPGAAEPDPRFALLLAPPPPRTAWRVVPARVGAMCAVELQKLLHDRTEIYTRAVQPALWLLIFGTTFSRIHAIPTGGVPYLDFLAPGIIARSAMFIAIFYGIMIIWERDSGVLTKRPARPAHRHAVPSRPGLRRAGLRRRRRHRRRRFPARPARPLTPTPRIPYSAQEPRRPVPFT